MAGKADFDAASPLSVDLDTTMGGPSPASPRSLFDSFLATASDDILEWTADWEQRSASMDERHVQVLSSHWQLMRESAKEHSQIIHQMKKAMHEMRANGITLEDRLNALELRLRDEVGREGATRSEDLERRLRERIRQEQASREADIAELRDLFKTRPEHDDALGARVAGLEDALAQEKKAREASLRRNLDDLEIRVDEKCGALQARVNDIERLFAASAAKQEDMMAALKDELLGDYRRWEQVRGDREATQRAAEAQALEASLAKLRDAIEEAVKGATLEEVEELVAAERAAREADLSLLQRSTQVQLDKQGLRTEALKAELREESEGRAAALGALKRGLEDQLYDQGKTFDGKLEVLRLAQTSAEERLMAEAQSLSSQLARLSSEAKGTLEALRDSLAGRGLADLEARLDSVRDELLHNQDSMESRVEGLLQILQKSTGSMVLTWRDGQDEASDPSSVTPGSPCGGGTPHFYAGGGLASRAWA